MIISMDFEVPMGHRLQAHRGKCRFPHGHNYLITVHVNGRIDSSSGMVMDFSELKEGARTVLSRFDHCTILQAGDPFANLLLEEYRIGDAIPIKLIVIDVPPTAENIATLLQDELRKCFLIPSFSFSVEVRETRDTATQPTGETSVPIVCREVESEPFLSAGLTPHLKEGAE